MFIDRQKCSQKSVLSLGIMIPGKPRKSPSKRANQLAREYRLNYDDVRTGLMLEWLGRQTAIGAVQGTYEGRTPAERDLLRQFTIEERQQVAIEEAPANKESDDPIMSLYEPVESPNAENGNRIDMDRDEDNDDDGEEQYELEVLRVQHFDEVVLPALITIVTTVVFFLLFSTLVTPFLPNKANF